MEWTLPFPWMNTSVFWWQTGIYFFYFVQKQSTAWSWSWLMRNQSPSLAKQNTTPILWTKIVTADCSIMSSTWYVNPFGKHPVLGCVEYRFYFWCCQQTNGHGHTADAIILLCSSCCSRVPCSKQMSCYPSSQSATASCRAKRCTRHGGAREE